MSDVTTPDINELSDAWRTPILLFADYLRYEKQYSAHTVNQYTSQLGFAALYFSKLCEDWFAVQGEHCLLYTSPSPRDRTRSRMPSSA